MDQVPGWPVDLSALRDWLLKNNASMVDDVRAFVELESPSDDTQALGDAARWLEEWIIDRVGPPVSCRREGGAGYGDTLVLTWPGSTARGERGTLSKSWPSGTTTPFGHLGRSPSCHFEPRVTSCAVRAYST